MSEILNQLIINVILFSILIAGLFAFLMFLANKWNWPNKYIAYRVNMPSLPPFCVLCIGFWTGALGALFYAYAWGGGWPLLFIPVLVVVFGLHLLK